MLFTIADITTPVNKATKKQSWMLSEHIDQENVAEYAPNITLSDILPPLLEPSVMYTLFSDGQWSQYELVDYLLRYTGDNTKMYFSTWAMSEYSARQIALWQDSGRLSEVWGVLDLRSKTRHPSSYDIARMTFEKVKLTNCHAKVTVLMPQDAAKPHICIVGSSNWTQNPRKECSIVINSPKSAQRHINWIRNIVEQEG